MKYKLIKKYPGIPDYKEKGDVVEKCFLGYKDESGYIYHSDEVENYPEYWEKIDKEYKVLDYKYSLVRGFYTPEKIITKVKRISDGSIFCVGDTIVVRGKLTKIKKFKEGTCGLIIVHVMGAAYLKDIVGEKPILTTEDGVDIYDKDRLVYLVRYSTDFIKVEEKAISCIERWQENWKIFSNEEERDKYIFENKPCLSYSDIESIWDTCALGHLINGTVLVRNTCKR